MEIPLRPKAKKPLVVLAIDSGGQQQRGVQISSVLCLGVTLVVHRMSRSFHDRGWVRTSFVKRHRHRFFAVVCFCWLFFLSGLRRRGTDGRVDSISADRSTLQPNSPRSRKFRRMASMGTSDHSRYAKTTSTGFGTALMCASPMDVVDLKGDVHSRPVFPRGVATVLSCIFGLALICASAIDVVDRNVAEPVRSTRRPLRSYDASIGLGCAWI